MAISHINGIDLSTISHINGIDISTLSHYNGQELPTGGGPTVPPVRVAGWAYEGLASSSVSGALNVTGSDNAIIAIIAIDSAVTTVTGVTFNGAENFSFVGRQTGTGQSVEIWVLENPTAGTATVAATLSGSANSTMETAHFTGVDQTTPAENFIGTFGSADNGSVNVTSNTGSLVIGGTNRVTAGDHTYGAGQSGITGNGHAGTTNSFLNASQEAGTNPTTHSYSWTLTENFTLAACSLKGL
jgi:hypothetical protein